MRKNYLVYVLAAMLLVICSCSSDTPEGPQVSKGEKITLRVNMPTDNDTQACARVAFDDASLNLTWQSGDQLALIGYNAKGKPIGKSVLSMEGSAGSKEAVFSGYTVEGATQYDVYYPAKGVDNNGKITIDYDSQTQTGNNNTEHLKTVILLKQEKKRLTTQDLLQENANTKMMMQNAIIKFVVNGMIYGKPVSLIWEITTPKKGIISRTLNLKGTELKNNTFTGYLSIPSMSIDAQNIYVYVLSETNSNSKEQTKLFYYTKEFKNTQRLEYNANQRKTAEIDNLKDTTAIIYTSNVQLDISMFNPKPSHSSWDKKTGKGFMVCTSNEVSFKPGTGTIKNNLEELSIIGISSIASSAFSNFNKLQKIVLNSGIETIEKSTFEGCKGLTQCSLPQGIKKIDNNAFKGCTNMKNIILPDSLESIGTSAFENCNLLETITIPQKISIIQKATFKKCDALKEFKFKGEEIKAIEEEAFDGCLKLLSIELPLSVESIGDHSFRSCNALKSIEIPTNVTSIGKHAFESCQGMEKLVVRPNIPPKLYNIKNDPLGLISSISILVPKDYIKTYEEAEGWKFYYDRILSDDLPINNK